MLSPNRLSSAIEISIAASAFCCSSEVAPNKPLKNCSGEGSKGSAARCDRSLAARPCAKTKEWAPCAIRIAAMTTLNRSIIRMTCRANREFCSRRNQAPTDILALVPILGSDGAPFWQARHPREEPTGAPTASSGQPAAWSNGHEPALGHAQSTACGAAQFRLFFCQKAQL